MTQDDEHCYLSEEERALWQQHCADMTPYNTPQKPSAPPRKPLAQLSDAPRLSSQMTRLPSAHLPALSAGSFAGVDKGTVKKLKRGQLAIDRSIDLHGMSQPRAYDALERQIMQSLLQGQRLLLVITGKGQGGQGVIKSALPAWLNDDRLRPYLLAFDEARREDGGSGAFYVLLKKLVKQA